MSFAGKIETIDALKDNIREAIGAIQLHTNNKLDRSCRVLHMASRGSYLNEIIFHYKPKGLYFQIKKEIEENFQYFSKHFQ